MLCNIDFKKASAVGAVLAVASTVTAGVAQLAGHSIGLLKGAGFGFVQGAVTKIALDKMPKICPSVLRGPLAIVAGGLAGLGASHAIAALGFIAAPISVPAAIVLTVANVAIPFLCIKAFNSCCAGKDDGIKKAVEKKVAENAEKKAAEQNKEKAAEPPAAQAKV